MKQFLVITLTLLTGYLYAQDKYNYVNFNKLTEIKGTDYVIASIENRGKIETISQYLLFINTRDGKTKQIEIPKDASIQLLEQVRIDSLGINVVLLVARTVNLDNNKGIDWDDPKQVIILSTDGQQRTQLTEDKFFVNTWIINRFTGVIVITGYFDTNTNGKYDKTDRNEILIYDLKTLKLIGKI
jgi:hypothetical protein